MLFNGKRRKDGRLSYDYWLFNDCHFVLIRYRLAEGANENIQLGALVGAFKQALQIAAAS